MFIDGHYRMPTFLFESVWNIIGFTIICYLRRQKKLLLEGEVLAFYLIWYGIGRFVIEGMRTDSLIFIGLRVSQIVSIVLIILGIVFVILRRRQKGIPYYQE